MRIASQAKMGYVPTPDSQTQLIVKYLSLGNEEGIYRLLDTCAGEGIALRDCKNALQSFITNDQRLMTYGIELDFARAENAGNVLDHVVACAYEVARTTKQAYSLLWCNPPYDHVALDEDRTEVRQRKELTFLRGSVDYLGPDGVLVYIIPHHRLSENVAQTLAWRFENFAVFKFEEEEYQAYKQIVVLCKRKKQSGIKTDEEKAAFRYLRSVGKEEVDLPVLGDEQFSDYRLVVPPSSEPTSFEFRGSILDPIELAKDLMKSSVWKLTDPMISLVDQKVSGGQPLLPLKTAHLGTIIAAGAIDGVVGKGADRHMIVGLTRKTTDKSVNVDEKGREKEVYTQRFESAVKLYTPTGLIKELK